MNCQRCHTELPDGAAFCAQCGNPLDCKPIFPADTQDEQPKSQYTLLVACACVLGALLMITMFVGLALFNLQMSNRTRGACCSRTTAVAGAEENFNLYGKTIQDEDFDWESLRGKYVLVKFTATWCGPCQGEIPGMIEAYEKYHDKGLEIVSVYIWEREPDAVATVKNYIEKKKLPWIIISESLSEKAGQAPQGKTFGIEGVPTMLLFDKEGKMITDNARGETLQQELKKIFEE